MKEGVVSSIRFKGHLREGLQYELLDLATWKLLAILLGNKVVE